MNIDIKTAKIKELFHAGILNQTEYDKIISLLADLNSGVLDDSELDEEAREYLRPYEICKQNTSKMLVSPATAVYPSFSKDMIEELNAQDKSFKIAFYVDSQNKNGAFIRTQVKCLIENGVYIGTSFQQNVLKQGFFGAKYVLEWSPFEKPMV
jgi:hypothetical protein